MALGARPATSWLGRQLGLKLTSVGVAIGVALAFGVHSLDLHIPLWSEATDR